jgi:hypothetical protein
VPARYGVHGSVNPALYYPRFVTETDEPTPWDDCRVCALIHLQDYHTAGAITTLPNGVPMTKAQRRALRIRLRATLGPRFAEGGLRVEHAIAMSRAMWPWLPPIRQFSGTFDEMWEKLQNGWAFSISGNPSEVRDRASRFRRWTVDDNFGHEIVAARATSNVFIIDALGRGGYRGEREAKADLRQYAFLKPGNRVGWAYGVKVGAASPLMLERVAQEADQARMKRRLQARIAELEVEGASFTEGYEKGWGEALDEVEEGVGRVIADART